MSSAPTIKALPTLYNGIEYRSRLEAKWAVFFTKLNIPFDYEPEGYELRSGWYLPDFWIPQWGEFIEIKPTIQMDARWLELARTTNKVVSAIMGIFPKLPEDVTIARYIPDGLCKDAYWFVECDSCKRITMQSTRHNRWLCFQCMKWNDNDTSERIQRAFQEASKYQFRL